MKKNQTINKGADISFIPIESIPSLDLYVDQVTTFMDENLACYRRYNEDKTITKTMINNYAKAKLFPSPIKKRYTKNHIMIIILIYHLKGVLTINDITRLLSPINSEEDFKTNNNELSRVYKAFTEIQESIAEGGEARYNTRDISEIGINILKALSIAYLSSTNKRLAEQFIDENFSL